MHCGIDYGTETLDHLMISIVINRMDENLIHCLGYNICEINMLVVVEGNWSSHTAINYKGKVTW